MTPIKSGLSSNFVMRHVFPMTDNPNKETHGAPVFSI
jgi:hypothetical protein